MWIIGYLQCLVKHHLWVGSGYRYCLRCGKLEFDARWSRSEDCGLTRN
jgi:hypothetical protein